MVRVLGIESSCDETGVAVYCEARGLLAHAVYSQVDIHAVYGGVVPELASRDHIRRLVPLTRKVLTRAGCGPGDLDGVAYTHGPGLVGALLVGAAFGRSLAYAWSLPALPVHHMEGHLLSPMMASSERDGSLDFPFLALLVSGGHTLLVLASRIGCYEVLGETLDDAVGEAFDKTAALLGLGYPGGPQIERVATEGNPSRFRFPRPMTDRPGLDFSFSGLKTFARNTLRDHQSEAAPRSERVEGLRADIARAFQDAVIDTVRIKCERAVRATGVRSLVVSGGVGANRAMRETLTVRMARLDARVHFPPPELCTDNGAMIAYAGLQRLRAGGERALSFGVRPRWSLETLEPTGP